MKDSKFYKDCFLKTDSFKPFKDLIPSILQDDKLYSEKEVLCLISNYLNKEAI